LRQGNAESRASGVTTPRLARATVRKIDLLLLLAVTALRGNFAVTLAL